MEKYNSKLAYEKIVFLFSLNLQAYLDGLFKLLNFINMACIEVSNPYEMFGLCSSTFSNF